MNIGFTLYVFICIFNAFAYLLEDGKHEIVTHMTSRNSCLKWFTYGNCNHIVN